MVDWSSCFGEEDENVKILQQQQYRQGQRQRRTNYQKSSFEPSAQVS